METKKVLEHLKANVYSHKYHYLDWEVVTQCHSLLKLLSKYIGTSNATRRDLQKSLMTKYGVLECEAINIVNNYHCGDYVNKYQRYKFCDDYRVVLLGYLCTMNLPEELEKEQVVALSKVFLGREKDKEILKVWECEDGQERIWLETFLQEQLKTKKRKQEEID